MFGLGASAHFPEAGSWWHDPPPLASAESPWDVTGIAAWQKHLEEETELSPLEGDSAELLEAEDPELEAIKAKIREMEEEEEERVQGLQTEAKHFLMGPGLQAGLPFPCMTEEKAEVDQRSIYVGNVDYGGTAEELESHFNSCGEINRVTILCDKFSGHPKGYAYIEFADKRSVQAAAALDESTFRGRLIKVLPKRTNMPGISTTDRGGSRGRFHSRGVLPHRAGFCRGPRSRPHGGRVYRGRGRIVPWYTPY
ncbi:embryonic polyadenylate-binding protein 2 [Eublepharis macularius]|uniref:Embryonic polyadenylate-binding protein 2 n=1 Tax=Eublepharis macularius TaxID=481883 RepID=A0AA97LIK5_EUBMA|nr:embryonic polyadenylate-binding protein 2 [Eublepharis macularius]